MAVVQISKIQIRRGRKNQGEGLPQLASGEMGWALDTQELFIGNGSVAEGAPFVGNTKVLTQYDNLFSIAGAYTYKVDDGYVSTGISPIKRTLQDRLDDRVSIKAFGATGNSSQDATVLLQTALDQLFLNNNTKSLAKSRVSLHLEAGVYTTSSTIYLPPHASIIGDGPNKTIIRNIGTGPIFKTVTSDSTPGVYNTNVTSSNRPQHITIKNCTIEATTNTTTGLDLYAITDSLIENIHFKSVWNFISDEEAAHYSLTDCVAILLESKSKALKSMNNIITGCHFYNWFAAVKSDTDIENNIFDSCYCNLMGYGFLFGSNMIISSDETVATRIGPYETKIINSKFFDIGRQAIYIKEGTNNRSLNNHFTQVGNDGGDDSLPVTSVIYFENAGNSSNGDMFSRTKVLSYDQEFINSKPYIAEIDGIINYTNNEEHVIRFPRAGSPTLLFRLPSFEHQVFIINYHLRSLSSQSQRSGILKIVNDSRLNDILLSDEYDVLWDGMDSSTAVSFTAEYTTHQSLRNINVLVTNLMPAGDQSEIKFTITCSKNVAIS